MSKEKHLQKAWRTVVLTTLKDFEKVWLLGGKIVF